MISRVLQVALGSIGQGGVYEMRKNPRGGFSWGRAARTRPRMRRPGSRHKIERLEDRRCLDSTVVFNEVMYHPADPAEMLEWIELHNQMSVDLDLTGWSVSGGIDYEFPSGTRLTSGGHLVVARSPSDLQAAHGFSTALGPFRGRLSNGGETLRLLDNNGRVMDELEYGDQGEWPVGADGSGASLAKIDPQSATSLAANWSLSREVRGTPGAKNLVASTDVRINEVSAGRANEPFWVELVNRGTVEISLDQFALKLLGNANGVTLPAERLSPGQHFVWTATGDFRAGLQEGDALILLSSNGQQVHDAIDITSRLRGRFPDGADEWWFPTTATPGTANQVATVDQIVINEIMYDHRDEPARGPILQIENLLEANASWRYDDSGRDRGTLWREADFDDTGWSVGSGPLASEALTLPEPVRTRLRPDQPTYYFRTEFQVDGAWLEADIELSAAVDDGAVFYLNGQEIWRTNMPQGQVDFQTRALVSAGPAAFAAPVRIPAQALQTGMNVLAVEVHQAPQTTAYYRFEDGGPSGRDVVDALTGNDHGDLRDKAGLSTEVPISVVPQTGQPNTHSYHAQSLGRGLGSALMNADGSGAAFVFNEPTGDATLEWYMKVPVEERHNPIFWTDPDNVGTGFNIFYNANFTGQPNTQRVIAGGLEDDVQIIGTYDNGNPLTLDQWHHVAIVRNDLGGGRLRWTWYLDGVHSPGHGRVTTGGPWPDIVPWTLTGRPGQAFNVLLDEIRMSRIALQPDQFLNAPPAAVAVGGDVVFGAKLTASRTAEPAAPRRPSAEEWIELYNRGETAIDLSGWQLNEAVSFAFPAGTRLNAHEHAVVALRADGLQQQFPEARILGEYGGSLSDGGERIRLLDARGNLADEVRYSDEAPWPADADGRFSSLELRDPWADNRRPEAWAASDEREEGRWELFRYRGTAGKGDSGNPDYHELVIGMLDRGEILLDDVQVVENPDSNPRQLIQNSSFDVDTDKWRIIGSHSGTVVPDPDDPTNSVLRLSATGATNDIHNHGETTLKFENTFVQVTPNREYEISFRARWLSGSNQFHTRLYFNELPRTHLLQAASRQGTPGRPNSTLVSHLGPTYSELRHSPPLPAANQPISVSVVAHDSQGIHSMLLHYAVAASAWASVSMVDQGQGRYVGLIPGQAAKAIVQFYVTGTDSAGATSTYPAEGEASRALIQVEDGRGRLGALHNLRVIMTAADNTAMHRPTELMSNARRLATVVINESDVIYNVGIRLNGASSSRQGTNGYNLQFPADRPFRGVHSTVIVDRNNVNEILIRQLINHAGGVPSMYNDGIQFIGPTASRSGFAQLRMARFGNEYFSNQYEDGDEGLVFEKELTYRQALSVPSNRESLKTPQGYSHPVELNTEIQDYGDDPEAYRWHWLVESHPDRDDYGRIIELNQAMSLSGGELEAALEDVVDVDQWLRAFATMRLFGNRDFYSQPTGTGAQDSWRHNFRVYQRPEDDKLLMLPWDIDESFQVAATDNKIFGVGNVSKWIQLPDNLHHYFGHLHDLLTSSFNTDYLTPWADHYAELFPGVDFRTPQSYIPARNRYVLSKLPTAAEFQLLDSGPAVVNEPFATISGTGWINVREIRLSGRELPLEVRWTTPTTWQATVPLLPGVNQWQLEAYDFQGEKIGTPFENRLTIQRESTVPTARSALRITELQYRPGRPTLQELAAGIVEADDFSYIELYNRSAAELDLRGVRFVEGVRFDFSDSSVQSLAAGARVLVAENADALRLRVGEQVAIAGDWAGGLDGDGESLHLIDHTGQTIHRFAYDVIAPWPELSESEGASIEVRDTESDYNAATNWAASRAGGSPGQDSTPAGDLNGDRTLNVADIDYFFQHWRLQPPAPELDLNGDGKLDTRDRDHLISGVFGTQYGDANLNRQVNSSDLVLLMANGEYEDGVPGNSSWSDGDFDGDGEFSTSDLVLIFQSGGYSDA